jgi:tRNA dimethylallyltransferase
MVEKEKIIFITGPTSSGKSDLAIDLAKKINGEVINADSRQVYKYLDIGSGKIETINQNGLILSKKYLITHHLLSIASPRKNYSLGQWLIKAKKTAREIIKRNKIPIFCGGTMLYLKALKEGWQLPSVKADYKLRKRLEKENVFTLYQQLKKINPRRAKEIGSYNKRRIIRALEVAFYLGKIPPLKKNPEFNMMIITPLIEKEKLFKKIKKRLEIRLPGIIAEIKKLRKIGLSFRRIINFGLEYEWFGKYVRGDIDLSTAKEKCYLDIVRFAKKQIRELKKIPGLVFVKRKEEVLKNFI